MIQLVTALWKAEAVKVRRTPALLAVVAVPTVVSLMGTVALLSGKPSTFVRPPADVWNTLIRTNWVVWLAFFVPMLITFEAASLANLEHRGHHWKQLLALPLPRWSVYATKIVCCAVFLAAAFALFTLEFIANALLYSVVRDQHLQSAIPMGAILLVAGKAWLTCFPAIVIQSWLSARISEFGTAIGTGVAGLVIGYTLLSQDEGLLSRWYPWTISMVTGPSGPSHYAHDTMLPIVFAIVGGLALAVIACRDLARRDRLN